MNFGSDDIFRRDSLLKAKIISSICLCFLIAVIAGCTEDNVIQPRVGYSKEEIIGVLVESYELNSIDLYKGLLHRDYIWIFQEEDYEPGEDNHLSKEDDVQATNNIFDAVKGEYFPPIDSLFLEINEEPWIKIDSIAGEPYSDCWMTVRLYYIIIFIDETAYIGRDLVRFYIAPVNASTLDQYRIIRAEDIDIRSRAGYSKFSIEYESWGIIKKLFLYG